MSRRILNYPVLLYFYLIFSITVWFSMNFQSVLYCTVHIPRISLSPDFAVRIHPISNWRWVRYPVHPGIRNVRCPVSGTYCTAGIFRILPSTMTLLGNSSFMKGVNGINMEGLHTYSCTYYHIYTYVCLRMSAPERESLCGAPRRPSGWHPRPILLSAELLPLCYPRGALPCLRKSWGWSHSHGCTGGVITYHSTLQPRLWFLANTTQDRASVTQARAFDNPGNRNTSLG